MAIDPTRTALLLMDFQPAVVDSVAQPAAVLERARAALDWARGAQVRVGWVRVAFTSEDHARIPERNKIFRSVAAHGALPHDSPQTAIHSSLEVREGDLVVRKTRVGAFSTTDLAQQLRAEGIDTLVLAGISTSGVVLSTVRDAADADFRLFVLADATADHDPEVHRVLLEKVIPRQADVITTGELPV